MNILRVGSTLSKTEGQIPVMIKPIYNPSERLCQLTHRTSTKLAKDVKIRFPVNFMPKHLKYSHRSVLYSLTTNLIR